jgi:hypothetical protein
MKRILFWSVLVTSLMLLQPSPASVAEEKQQTGWKTVEDFKVLKMWEQPQGPKWPQVAMLQLSNERFKELENDPLAFYKKYEVFKPSSSDRDQGHAVFNLVRYSAKSKDDVFVIIVHDGTTWSAFTGFEVSYIR